MASWQITGLIRGVGRSKIGGEFILTLRRGFHEIDNAIFESLSKVFRPERKSRIMRDRGMIGERSVLSIDCKRTTVSTAHNSCMEDIDRHATAMT